LDTKLEIRSDPVATRNTIDILSQVSISALNSMPLLRSPIGTDHQVHHHIWLNTPPPLSRPLLPPVHVITIQESNGYPQSRFDRNHQKIQTWHRDQMYRSTSQPCQHRLLRNRKTNPRNPQPSPSNHQVSLHLDLQPTTTNNITKLFRYLRRTQRPLIHRSKPRRPPTLLGHTQYRYQHHPSTNLVS
jgi:hypothetical protein